LLLRYTYVRYIDVDILKIDLSYRIKATVNAQGARILEISPIQAK